MADHRLGADQKFNFSLISREPQRAVPFNDVEIKKMVNDCSTDPSRITRAVILISADHESCRQIIIGCPLMCAN